MPRNETAKNNVDQCSFSDFYDAGKGAFMHTYGWIQISQINITKCSNFLYSCFQIGGLNKNSTISFSNFENNNASVGQCISLEYSNNFFLSYSAL